jgi:hypothetical protein
VAALCIYEDMPDEAEQIVRAICGRHNGTRRNPWNEIECGDHYARAMSSYGVLLAASGFFYDGPQAALTFGPRMGADDFRSFYTAGTSWGTYAQQQKGGALEATVAVTGGTLGTRTLRLRHAGSGTPRVTASAGGQTLSPRVSRSGEYAVLDLGSRVDVAAGSELRLTLA